MGDELSVGLVLGSNDNSFISLDFDNYSEETVTKETKRLIKEHKLGNAVLTTTSPKHWQINFFWNTMSFIKAFNIAKNSVLIDREFIKHRKKQCINRLRIGTKNGHTPTIKKIIKSPYHKNNNLGEFFYKTYKSSLIGEKND